MWSNLKSSIPADAVLQGRPYGGTGFICKPVQNCTFHGVPREDDRISVIEILNNNRVVITLISVYLPYFHSESTPLYSETLDKLHGTIQNITSPCILLGDMNAQMPHTAQLPSQWYKSKPYNNHMTLCAIMKWPVPTFNINNQLLTHTDVKNTSDHLPMKTTITLQTEQPT